VPSRAPRFSHGSWDSAPTTQLLVVYGFISPSHSPKRTQTTPTNPVNGNSPGLAVRIIGEFTRRKLEVCRRASAIVENILKKHGLYDKVWQAFAVVGDDVWVGVKGDARRLGYIVTVRIVESSDAMTADYAKIPYSVLDEISREITRSIDEVTMVTYAVTTKPPSTIEPC
jgi:GMP synthase (glutamine-hydrolysing)